MLWLASFTIGLPAGKVTLTVGPDSGDLIIKVDDWMHQEHIVVQVGKVDELNLGGLAHGG